MYGIHKYICTLHTYVQDLAGTEHITQQDLDHVIMVSPDIFDSWCTEARDWHLASLKVLDHMKIYGCHNGAAVALVQCFIRDDHLWGNLRPPSQANNPAQYEQSVIPYIIALQKRGMPHIHWLNYYLHYYGIMDMDMEE